MASRCTVAGSAERRIGAWRGCFPEGFGPRLPTAARRCNASADLEHRSDVQDSHRPRRRSLRCARLSALTLIGDSMTAPSPPPTASGGHSEAHRSEDPPVTDGEAPETTEPVYGFPAGLWRALERRRPPGVSLLQRWRSPLRGPWLTSIFGSALLIGLPGVILTGPLSFMANGPQFAQAIPDGYGWLTLPTFDWPSRPSTLNRH